MFIQGQLTTLPASLSSASIPAKGADSTPLKLLSPLRRTTVTWLLTKRGLAVAKVGREIGLDWKVMWMLLPPFARNEKENLKIGNHQFEQRVSMHVWRSLVSWALCLDSYLEEHSTNKTQDKGPEMKKLLNRGTQQRLFCRHHFISERDNNIN